MDRRLSESYRSVVEKARWSHDHNRSVFHINEADVQLGRLFTYAYRSQTIGAFYATRIAIENLLSESTRCAHRSEHLERATLLLKQLEAWAVEPVPRDFRAVILSFHYYDLWVDQVMDLLEAACVARAVKGIERVRGNFITNLNSITMGNGLCIANDTRVPEQASFLVPDLNIVIIPLIYGDHHSWNVAHLTAGGPSVPLHRHRKGVEIHLGLSPIKGRTFLGSCVAEVNEGYAMPIPPMTDHGFENLSGHDHFVPFIFGSRVMGGWGILFDVESRAGDLSHFRKSDLSGPELNGTVHLERAIQQVQTLKVTRRQVLVPAWRTGTPEIGGLELAVARVNPDGLKLTSELFKIVSVRSGKGRIRIGPMAAELGEGDHIGVPAGMDAHISQIGPAPLVILDSLISDPAHCDACE